MEKLFSTFLSVSELVDLFQQGDIAVPEIQRDVVWDGEKVKSLIDSISEGYPCGSLILWEPRDKDASVVRSMIKPEREKYFQNKLPKYFLIDGQQRLTALASVVLQRGKFNAILSDDEKNLPFIFADLRRFPREFEASQNESGYKFPWVAFNTLFDATIQPPEFMKLDPEKIEHIRKAVQSIRDYKFPVQIIRDRNYEKVAEIFKRVNTLGTKLVAAEINLAQIVPHWKGIARELRIYRSELAAKNYTLDLTFLLRAIAVVECRAPRLKTLTDKIKGLPEGKKSRRHLDALWKRSKQAIDKLVRTLQRDLLLDKSKFVYSQNAMVPLVYYFAAEQSKPAIKSVLRFFLLSQLSGHYSASSETGLKKDFRILTNTSLTPRKALAELVENVDWETRQGFRGLKLKPDDIVGPASKNVLVLLFYILMRKRSAMDWGTEKPSRLEDIPPGQVELHHIFPFNFMVSNPAALRPFTEAGWSPYDFRAAINDVANLTFLGQAKNASIGDTPPWEYLPNQTTKLSRKAHFIPEDPELWKQENFMKFLAERRRMLAAAINSFVKSLH